MLIAIVLITIGRSAAKKNIPDAAKFKRSFWFYLIALLIILATVPWPFRAGIGRPWLEGDETRAQAWRYNLNKAAGGGESERQA